MPTSPIPNWDEALLAEPLPDAAFVPVFELVWLSSPHAARSSANAPAPPAPTIFRNFLRDAGSASIRRTAPSRGFGSSIGGPPWGLPAARCLRGRGPNRIRARCRLAPAHSLAGCPARAKAPTLRPRHDPGREMEEHAHLLRRGYAAFAEGGLETAMGVFADDIRWHGPRSNGLPDRGTFHGKDEVAWMFKQLIATYGDELRLTPDEFIVDGTTIVVLGRLEAAPRGVSLKVPWVHVWKFDQGAAARVLTLTDTALVRDVLGT